jgi:hypothetical protein
MSTLTNTKIKDTYDGLLKTQDSTQGIPATGKVLIEDGVGNDSALSLGRVNNGAEITGTITADSATVNGNANVINGQATIQSSGNQARVNINNTNVGDAQINFQQSGGSIFSIGVDNTTDNFSISQNHTLGTNEYFSVSQTLGMKAKIGGTAGANELDDYEEGTYNLTFDDANSTDAWNATNWVSSGGTTFTNSSKYVKVGRQVTLFIDLLYKGKPTDMADTPIRLSNLPFTVASAGGGTFTFDLVETLSSSQKPTLFGMAGLLVWYHGNSVINFYNQTIRQDGGWGTSSTMDADNFPTTEFGELENKRFTGTFTYYTNQ